jgi:capsular polysaccharide biosynthesis protein
LTLRRGVRTWFLFAALCTVVGGLAGFGLALAMPPSYASTVDVIIAPPLNSGTSNAINDIQVSQALVPTYAELASSRTLLDRVIATTGIATTSDKLAGAVSTHAPVGTNFLQITVSDRDPSSAAELANSIAVELAKYQLFGTGATTDSGAVTVTVVDPAVPPTKPQGLGTLLTAALGAVVGLMMAIGFAFVVENLRNDNGPTADPA